MTNEQRIAEIREMLAEAESGNADYAFVGLGGNVRWLLAKLAASQERVKELEALLALKGESKQ